MVFWILAHWGVSCSGQSVFGSGSAFSAHLRQSSTVVRLRSKKPSESTDSVAPCRIYRLPSIPPWRIAKRTPAAGPPTDAPHQGSGTSPLPQLFTALPRKAGAPTRVQVWLPVIVKEKCDTGGAAKNATATMKRPENTDELMGSKKKTPVLYKLLPPGGRRRARSRTPGAAGRTPPAPGATWAAPRSSAARRTAARAPVCPDGKRRVCTSCVPQQD